MPKIRRFTLISSALIALSVVLNPAVDAQGQIPLTVMTSHFPVATPEDQGIDSNQLANAIHFLLDNENVFRIHSLMMIRNRQQVLNASFYPFDVNSRHDLASVTKAFIATLIGIAIGRGDIASVHQPVVSFFPDRTIANLDVQKATLTIDHLLTMRSGLMCDPNDGMTFATMLQSDDWVQFVLDLPMAEPPGQTRVYCNPNYHLLSAILQQASGLSALDFAQQYLFGPLDITDVLWPQDPQGVNHGWGDLQLPPLAMAKLGQVYLDAGVWQSQQIVPSAWVWQATTPPPGSVFAYHWMVTPDYIEAEGRGGQKIRVYPTLNLVVVQTGGGSWDEQMPYWEVYTELYESYLLDAIQSNGPLMPNAEGIVRLNRALAQASTSGESPGPVPQLPETAHTVSGLSYLLAPNIAEFSDLTISFPGGNEALLQLTMPVENGGPEIGLRVGLDGIDHLGTGRYGLTAGARGQWESENQFVVIIDEIGLLNVLRLSISFEANMLNGELEVLNHSFLPPVALEGVVMEPGFYRK